jgi:tetratricopeptide (TPR) repeat protein
VIAQSTRRPGASPSAGLPGLFRGGALAVLFAAVTAASGLPQTPATGGHAAAADPAAVERQLLEAVARAPDSFEAQRALAGFYLQQHALEKALPHLERAATLDPAHYATGYDLALALLETGRLEAARQQATRLLAVRPTGELHSLLGDIEVGAGHPREAAEAYQRAAHLDPTEGHLLDWGNSLLQLGARNEAIQVFEASVARQPASGRLLVGLGIAYYAAGRYRDAVESLTRAVDLTPDDPRPYEFLGELYGVAPELGDEVTARLARFVAAYPDNALAHLQYGLSLWKGHRDVATPVDTARVEAELKRAVSLDPTLARAHLELGVLLSEQERFAEAIPALIEAARLDPDLAQAHYRLAQAYQRTGQPELAARALETFRRLKGAR